AVTPFAHDIFVLCFQYRDEDRAFLFWTRVIRIEVVAQKGGGLSGGDEDPGKALLGVRRSRYSWRRKAAQGQKR
ncbi:hypothetical protein JW916_11350, partial [Candidatus Sumerlaeota bacterium]|nr:hypothetical protein [Candidatus Sumerlaeota bacterium]